MPQIATMNLTKSLTCIRPVVWPEDRTIMALDRVFTWLSSYSEFILGFQICRELRIFWGDELDHAQYKVTTCVEC